MSEFLTSTASHKKKKKTKPSGTHLNASKELKSAVVTNFILEEGLFQDPPTTGVFWWFLDT